MKTKHLIESCWISESHSIILNKRLLDFIDKYKLDKEFVSKETNIKMVYINQIFGDGWRRDRYFRNIRYEHAMKLSIFLSSFI